MPNAVPLMRASEMRTMSVDALREQPPGSAAGPTRACPGPPFGPALRSTSTESAVDVERRVVDAGCDVVDVLEDDGRAAVAEELRARRRSA